MKTTDLDWENGLPRSTRTGDVYFSAQDGLAETRHVFLGGNSLPVAWHDKDLFTIGEIGFGTGLNFLAAATSFLETTHAGHLCYIGLERYPLSRAQAAQALARWRDDLPFMDTLLAHWPVRVGGFQWIPLHPRITLLMIHEDAAQGLSQLVAPRGVDAWFLDGFSPAKDPAAWHPALYHAMAAHSHDQTTLATFTAAGHVRDGLAQAGFAVERIKGYEHKRHMTRARFLSGKKSSPVTPRCATILGGGLAGSACYHALSRLGVTCTIVDPDPDLNRAASGNPWGAVKPRLTARPSARSAYHAAGYALARQIIPPEARQDIPALHLRAETDLDAYDWHPDHARYVDDPSDLAGVHIEASALYFPDALLVQPKKLCAAWRGEVTGEATESDITIHATGSHYTGIRAIRGQITMVASTPLSAKLRSSLFYGGYVTPAMDGAHVIGASFERDRIDIDPSDEEDQRNLAKLSEAVPTLAPEWHVTGRRAALRANTPDRLPLVGRLDARTYLSVGHGSHGLLSTPLAAAIIAADLFGLPAPLPRDVLNAVAGDRFIRRS